MKLFERRIIESLDNEYYFLTLETTGKYSIYNSREYNANFYRHVIDSIIGVIVLFLFPFLPLIPKLIRFSYVKGDSTNVNFITSPNQRFSSSEFRLGLVSGDKIIFPFHCYFSYLKLIIEFYKKYKLKLWYYQAVLKLPELFTVTNCIYNLKPHSVTMSNHCDRWALMLSFICEDLNIPLNLYQHGILETKDDLLKPKVKIGRVTNLYCYDDVSLELFKENICESIVNVFFYENELKIRSSSHPFCSIFLVGRARLDKILDEIDLINEILSWNHSVRILIKPHPNSKYAYLYKERLKNDNVEVIDYIPKALVLLHSGSTLAYDYEKKRIGTVIIDTTNISNCSIVELINNVLLQDV